MDKIIFLDIDGVLNVITQGRDQYGSTFHKHFEENLKFLIDNTGAKIVISSSWRMSGLSVMQAMWKDRGLAGEVIDRTPSEYEIVKSGKAKYYDLVCRGDEIQHYIETHSVKNYVIIDDDDDMLENQMWHFVKCSGNFEHEGNVEGYGLTMLCAETAIAILKGDEVIEQPEPFKTITLQQASENLLRSFGWNVEKNEI